MQNEDQKFFREVMANVEPLKKVQSNIERPSSPSKVEVAKTRSSIPSLQSEKYSFYDNEIFPFSAEAQLAFARPGFSNQKDLRTGKWPAQSVLDLHGYTVDEAREAVSVFIQKSMQFQYRCIIIIHGKGREDKPILKNKLAQWLPQCQDVLAFCSALPKDGGAGAVYVLLKVKN